MFDVGIIYLREKDSALCLALSPTLLITIDGDGFEEVRPRSIKGFIERRKLKVVDLLISWRISVRLLDDITSFYMQDEIAKIKEERETREFQQQRKWLNNLRFIL